MGELFVLNKYFWKYRGKVLAGIFFVIASNVFRVLQPRLVREAMDKIVAILHENEGRTLPTETVAALGKSLSWFGLIIVLCAILMGVFMYFMRQTLIVVSRLVEYDQRNEIYAHFQTLDTAFYKRNKVGDLMSRIIEDVNKVRMYVGPALMYIVNTGAMFTMTIYAMVKVNLTLTLWCLAPLPLLSLAIYAVSRYINQRSTAVSQQLSELTSETQETYSGIRILKTYTQEARIAAHFAETNHIFRRKSLDKIQIDAFFMPTVAFLIGVSTVLVVYIGGKQVFAGNITTGNIAEFIIYVGMLSWPVASLGWVASLIQTANASQRRINEFVKMNSSLDTPIATSDWAENTENTEFTLENTSLENIPLENIPLENIPVIEFRRVTFVYPDTGIVALKNVSFKIKKGEKWAILGKTGSGKTSILELLCRMYDVTEGAILVEGRDVRSWDLAALRQTIGYVTQDVFLFSETVSNNIAFGVSHATQAEIEAYAGFAAIHQEVLDLAEGYNTIVGERGVMLSGGQKQRISIARALLKKPSLLLLDDCLSAVDTVTEQRILAYLEAPAANRTMILVTHRTHYLKGFDGILFLEKGEATEKDSAELVELAEDLNIAMPSV
ncbi:MAG: hypothetical protein RI894_608 [Bacteroidota bacterium]|jgi:ATP-binding cassette subfamily B protein